MRQDLCGDAQDLADCRKKWFCRPRHPADRAYLSKRRFILIKPILKESGLKLVKPGRLT
jgi:hypothetical protein